MEEAEIKAFNPKGIILSGGPETVTLEDTPRAPEYVFNADYKLYSDGRFYHFRNDPDELAPIDPVQSDQMAVYSDLKQVLSDRQQKRSDKSSDPSH